jgi:magnesium-transporting ATPase (P-type)
LVIGDLVQLSVGCNAPADVRVVSAQNLHIDKAAITGESVPVAVTPLIHVGATKSSFLEASNLVLLGTKVVEGQGTGIVIRTGDQCSMASVVRVSATEDQTQTTLHKEINRIVLTISGIAVFTCIIFLITWGAWLTPKFGGQLLSVAIGFPQSHCCHCLCLSANPSFLMQATALSRFLATALLLITCCLLLTMLEPFKIASALWLAIFLRACQWQ